MAYSVTGLLNLGCKDPRYRAVINGHFECRATLCASCLMEITLTNNKRKSYLCSVVTNDIMLHSFPANHQLHKTQVVYPLLSKNAPIKKLLSISLICENRAAVFTGHTSLSSPGLFHFFCLVKRKMTGQYGIELIESRLKY